MHNNQYCDQVLIICKSSFPEITQQIYCRVDLSNENDFNWLQPCVVIHIA